MVPSVRIPVALFVFGKSCLFVKAEHVAVPTKRQTLLGNSDPSKTKVWAHILKLEYVSLNLNFKPAKTPQL